jgi:hypothetical protein
MKTFQKLIKTITLMVIVFSCSTISTQSQEEDLLALDNLKLEIETFVNKGICNSISDCNYIAFGSKACGGPQSYLVYSNSIDVVSLKEKVSSYNQREKEYNLKWQIISDCSVPSPPARIECIDGKCIGVYN